MMYREDPQHESECEQERIRLLTIGLPGRKIFTRLRACIVVDEVRVRDIPDADKLGRHDMKSLFDRVRRIGEVGPGRGWFL